MEKAKSGLLLALAFAGSAMAACGGSGCKEESSGPDAVSTGLSQAFVRQELEKSLLTREGYEVVSLRSTEPIEQPETFLDFLLFKGTVTRYYDCFRVRRTDDDDHLYQKCVMTNLIDQTMLPDSDIDLGVRVPVAADLKPR